MKMVKRTRDVERRDTKGTLMFERRDTGVHDANLVHEGPGARSCYVCASQTSFIMVNTELAHFE